MSEKVSLVVSTGGTPRRSNNDDEVQEFQSGSPIGAQLIALVVTVLADAGSALVAALKTIRPTALTIASKLFRSVPLAKVGDSIVAATAGTAANALVVKNPIASRVGFPRNVVCVFGAGWDGGTVTVTGTDQFDQAVTEDFVGLVGGNTVTGTKIFKTITSAVKSAVGLNAATVTVGDGDKLAVPSAQVIANNAGILCVDGVAEAVTVDPATHAYTPTTAPNGAKVFTLLVNV